MPFVERDDVIETFPSDRADDAFAIGVLPLASPRRLDFLDAHGLDGFRKLLAAGRVPVVVQVSRRFVERKRLAKLLHAPLGRWMRCDANMQNPPIAVG